MTHLYKIKDKSGQIVTFKPNETQLRHWQERGDSRYNRILKPRQLGFTTLYCIELLDDCLWTQGMSTAIIAHEAKKLSSYFSIVKLAFEHLPEELKPTTRTDTKYRYDFLKMFDGTPLNSSIYVDTDIRGGTVQNLHITEVAYNKDFSRLAAGSKQAVPIEGRISEETTANGFNQFYDDFMSTWGKERVSEVDYKAHFYPWFLHSEYKIENMPIGQLDDYEVWLKDFAKSNYNIDLKDSQLAWRRWKEVQLRSQNQIAGLTGKQLFKQEYPSTVMEAFQSGAGNVFDAEIIEKHKPSREVDPFSLQDEKIKTLVSKMVKVWECPVPELEYVVGVDPSDGMGADYGTICVWTQQPCADGKYHKVAEYKGKLRPDELGDMAVLIAEAYNNAFLGVENNMLSCILHIATNTGYSNYFYTTTIDEKNFKKTKKLGWNTNSKTRDVMIDDFVTLFEEDALCINSESTLSEMRTFVTKENGKREHADGKHDDVLFADMIAQQMRKYRPRKARAFSEKPF